VGHHERALDGRTLLTDDGAAAGRRWI